MADIEVIFRFVCTTCGVVGCKVETTFPTEYGGFGARLPQGWRLLNWGDRPLCPKCRVVVDEYEAAMDAWRAGNRKDEQAIEQRHYAEKRAQHEAYKAANPPPKPPQITNPKTVQAAKELLGLDEPKEDKERG